MLLVLFDELEYFFLSNAEILVFLELLLVRCLVEADVEGIVAVAKHPVGMLDFINRFPLYHEIFIAGNRGHDGNDIGLGLGRVTGTPNLEISLFKTFAPSVRELAFRIIDNLRQGFLEIFGIINDALVNVVPDAKADTVGKNLTKSTSSR